MRSSTACTSGLKAVMMPAAGVGWEVCGCVAGVALRGRQGFPSLGGGAGNADRMLAVCRGAMCKLPQPAATLGGGGLHARTVRGRR